MNTALERIRRSLLICLAPAALVAFATAPVSAETVNPYAKDDGTWITISGTVESVRPDQFTLDYGDGVIIVEMDDGDRDADAYKLMPGDKVTVAGRIDDDFFETTSIEAGSVYIENLGTTFFSSAADEEDVDRLAINVTTPLVEPFTIVEGTVTAVNDDEFVVDTGLRKIRVDVDEMAYNPLDDMGYQKIRVGDRVSVRGQIDDGLFEGRELVADSVISLGHNNP